jgi:FlaA1/EpsC-like NDP-sugar epimerase
MMEMLTQAEQEALLGRRVEALLTADDRRAFEGRVCLITGGGGSVGAELARQVAACRPALVALVDHSEPALFQIEQELTEHWPSARVEPLLCDITRTATIRRIVRRIAPDVVFHAAAYKHVTMAERAICATARVNVIGTHAVAAAASDVGAEFVLISSDKAASPRSVMGATKRLAELITLALPAGGRRRIVVRFGNILASSGSFVEIARARIRTGQPVLVTDPDATRFFMTVAEAASLVMKASTLARDGETFWLDMGEQIRIGDLARRLLDSAARSGFRAVPIKVVGLRPGEKLNEQLASHGLQMERTAHPRIWVAHQKMVSSPVPADAFRRLRSALRHDDAQAVLKVLTNTVADFVPSTFACAIARNEKLQTMSSTRRREGVRAALSA